VNISKRARARISRRCNTTTMGSDGGEALVNRDTPIPVVQLHPADGSTPKAITPTTEPGSSHRLSASKLKDKLESLGDKHGHDTTSSRMGDKMFNLYHHPSHSQQTPTNMLEASSPKFSPQKICQTLLRQTPANHPPHPTSASKTAVPAHMSPVPTSQSPPCPPTSAASTPG